RAGRQAQGVQQGARRHADRDVVPAVGGVDRGAHPGRGTQDVDGLGVEEVDLGVLGGGGGGRQGADPAVGQPAEARPAGGRGGGVRMWGSRAGPAWSLTTSAGAPPWPLTVTGPATESSEVGCTPTATVSPWPALTVVLVRAEVRWIVMLAPPAGAVIVRSPG